MEWGRGGHSSLNRRKAKAIQEEREQAEQPNTAGWPCVLAVQNRGRDDVEKVLTGEVLVKERQNTSGSRPAKLRTATEN